MNYNGEIAGFPTEVVEKMLEYQVKQGNPRDITVFENLSIADYHMGGFTWDDTTEGYTFWSEVIICKNFDMFFEKYPKPSPYPKVMLVSNRNDIKNARKRVVFMEKLGKYIAWNSAETLADAEKAGGTCTWDFAWDLPKEEPIIELTLEDIAMLKGVDVNRIRIKD